jgi:EAL domain-containing protein (putative c-di-GMP-specific phosphodiesterase class I)
MARRPVSTPAATTRDQGILVRSIIGLGSSLGLRIVAEGVETAGVLEEVRDLGCDVIQGYHTGRPLPAGELAASLSGAALHNS